MSDDARFQQLNRWLDSCLPELFVAEGWGEVPPAELIPASSDASFRRYFRWQGGDRSLVVMDAPPPQEDCRPFVKVAGLLAGAGVHVPRILAQDLENGFLLLSDLGRQTYLDVLHPGNADELFEPALDALIAFQKVDVAGVLPVDMMDAARLEGLHLAQDPATGLKAIIAIHSTRLGPALGGCRYLPYPNDEAAIGDAIRLAQGMSYKAALAGLEQGGGKAVIIRPPHLDNRGALFEAFGRFIESLGGRYITAVDSGTSSADMDCIAQQTRHVTSTLSLLHI